MQQPNTAVGLERKDQFVLRFPESNMRKEIKARAAMNERSMNAELIYLIKRGQAEEQKKSAAA
ncbi:Arc family DNA-binding protein [Comamonas koreensis]|uniref:Arc family DNA-binding protein n=1 Tax=Comamonas koreensis TaxID=160825 RepID=A0AAW4XQH5_9BURK|nr:Arc family DNA-binding protein [Comamonas koreensis]MCD2163823.1 Arc family DNA-binding protein [Comamonas koreensis]